MEGYTEKIIQNRIQFANLLIKKYDLSLLDLCRIFETSPLGMKELMKYGEIQFAEPVIHHPELTDRILKNVFMDITQRHAEGKESFSEILTEYGLIRLPGTLVSIWDEVSSPLMETIKEEYFKVKGQVFRKKMEKRGISMLEIPLLSMQARKVIYELYRLGFKKNEIEEYASSPKSPFLGAPYVDKSWMKALIATYRNLNRPVISRNTRKRDENGNLITYDYPMPVQLATEQELRTFMEEGANISQIVAITGDKEVTITFVRERLDIQKSICLNKDMYSRDMFLAYVNHPDMKMDEIADLYFGKTRETFQRAVQKYLQTQATEEEKERFKERKKAANQMRYKNRVKNKA